MGAQGDGAGTVPGVGGSPCLTVLFLTCEWSLAGIIDGLPRGRHDRCVLAQGGNVEVGPLLKTIAHWNCMCR